MLNEVCVVNHGCVVSFGAGDWGSDERDSYHVSMLDERPRAAEEVVNEG